MLIKQHAPTTMALHLRWLFATDDDRMVPVCVRMHCMFAILPGINSPKSVALNALTTQCAKHLCDFIDSGSSVADIICLFRMLRYCYGSCHRFHSLHTESTLSISIEFRCLLSSLCVCVSVYARE